MDWNSPAARTASPMDRAITDDAQRTFMARVYRWMFVGLSITGLLAFYTASTPALLQPVLQYFYALIIAELGLVLALSWLAPRMGATAAGVAFLGYAALNGLTLSVIFLVYHLGSIGQAFFVTAGAFGALSLYATVTSRDLSAWATFLFIGLIGVVLAGVVQMFWPHPGLSFVWSCACVVVFGGLTAYDTQKLRRIYSSSYDGAGSLAIVGALALYLDFVNLFLALLRLMGRRR